MKWKTEVDVMAIINVTDNDGHTNDRKKLIRLYLPALVKMASEKKMENTKNMKCILVKEICNSSDILICTHLKVYDKKY